MRSVREAIGKDPARCELEGPYECPYCAGHLMVDSTYLDQESTLIQCPYCPEEMVIPE